MKRPKRDLDLTRLPDLTPSPKPTFATLPELDDLDEPMAAHVYCGRRILASVIVSPENSRYVLRDADGTILGTTRTAQVAIRLGDMYLEGYLQAAQDKEVIHVTNGTYWRDRREPEPTQSDRRNRDHDQGTTEGHGPG